MSELEMQKLNMDSIKNSKAAFFDNKTLLLVMTMSLSLMFQFQM